MKKLSFEPFNQFIQKNSIKASQERSSGVFISSINLRDEGVLVAVAAGSSRYNIRVNFDSNKVNSAHCTCPYDGIGMCKHIIKAVVVADERGLVQSINVNKSDNNLIEIIDKEFKLIKYKWQELTDTKLSQLVDKKSSDSWYYNYTRGWNETEIGKGFLTGTFETYDNKYTIKFKAHEEGILVSCSCKLNTARLCLHLEQALQDKYTPFKNIIFDESAHQDLLQKAAVEFGFSHNNLNLNDLFYILVHRGNVFVKPKINLIKVNELILSDQKNQILDKKQLPWTKKAVEKLELLVVSYNSYYGYFRIDLMQGNIAKNGSLKSPIEILDPLEVMKTDTVEEIQYYKALSTTGMFQSISLMDKSFENAFSTYRTILNNLQHPIFLFEDDGGKVTPNKLEAIDIAVVDVSPIVTVLQKEDYYEISCKFEFDGHKLGSQTFKLISGFMVRHNKKFLFWNSILSIKLHHYFSQNNHKIIIHDLQFENYRQHFLDELENEVKIDYQLIGNREKVKKTSKLSDVSEFKKIVYLTEEADYILLTPALRFQDSEIPLFSKRPFYIFDQDGLQTTIERNEWLEKGFGKLMRQLHPDFSSQNQNEFFYLQRRQFLDSGWFIDAFEELKEHQIEVLGFNQLSKNKFNSNKATVSNSVSSGIDWFDIETTVLFGEQKVRIQDLQKAIFKRASYVELGDGTHGVLPDEWISKFEKYFRTGELSNGKLRVHRSNFQLIDELFEEEQIDVDAFAEIALLKQKVKGFKQIEQVKIPKKLKATLRDYQKEGLNWLNFLDEFGFGGCLADDMGLGKTLQIIAYILTQHEKGRKDPNLIVLPTSLLFNWKAELKKFAPHITVCDWSGINRGAKENDFSKFDIVLTTYGTLLSDIELLRKRTFNLLVLDESQAIKNPNSKRYKAVRLLNGRQRLVLTGTPIENNTFDLFAQLSFAIPGLLGNAKMFLDQYANPIDKYQDNERAKELQHKVHPFILRRTKKQVAKELPEKTEMILYCEFGEKQRKVYDAYKTEFQERILSQTEAEFKKNTALILQGMMKLRQICNSTAILGDVEDYGTESAKLTELMSQIMEKKDEHKIIVFSQFVGMLDLIKRELGQENIKHCYLTGETRDRQAQVDQFQNDDETRVFLISLKAGGTGLNLTEADYVFIVDPWWNPAAENQAIDRAYRIGQTKHVMAIRMITPDTIEEKIMELQSRKKNLAEDLIRTDNAVLKQLTQKDLLSYL